MYHISFLTAKKLHFLFATFLHFIIGADKVFAYADETNYNNFISSTSTGSVFPSCYANKDGRCLFVSEKVASRWEFTNSDFIMKEYSHRVYQAPSDELMAAYQRMYDTYDSYAKAILNELTPFTWFWQTEKKRQYEEKRLNLQGRLSIELADCDRLYRIYDLPEYEAVRVWNEEYFGEIIDLFEICSKINKSYAETDKNNTLYEELESAIQEVRHHLVGWHFVTDVYEEEKLGAIVTADSFLVCTHESGRLTFVTNGQEHVSPMPAANKYDDEFPSVSLKQTSNWYIEDWQFMNSLSLTPDEIKRVVMYGLFHRRSIQSSPIADEYMFNKTYNEVYSLIEGYPDILYPDEVMKLAADNDLEPGCYEHKIKIAEYVTDIIVRVSRTYDHQHCLLTRLNQSVYYMGYHNIVALQDHVYENEMFQFQRGPHNDYYPVFPLREGINPKIILATLWFEQNWNLNMKENPYNILSPGPLGDFESDTGEVAKIYLRGLYHGRALERGLFEDQTESVFTAMILSEAQGGGAATNPSHYARSRYASGEDDTWDWHNNILMFHIPTQEEIDKAIELFMDDEITVK